MLTRRPVISASRCLFSLGKIDCSLSGHDSGATNVKDSNFLVKTLDVRSVNLLPMCPV